MDANAISNMTAAYDRKFRLHNPLREVEQNFPENKRPVVRPTDDRATLTSTRPRGPMRREANEPSSIICRCGYPRFLSVSLSRFRHRCCHLGGMILPSCSSFVVRHARAVIFVSKAVLVGLMSPLLNTNFFTNGREDCQESEVGESNTIVADELCRISMFWKVIRWRLNLTLVWEGGECEGRHRGEFMKCCLPSEHSIKTQSGHRTSWLSRAKPPLKVRHKKHPFIFNPPVFKKYVSSQ